MIAGGILGGVVDVQSMYLHTCVLRTGGSIQCWRNNDYGQPGNNSSVATTTPITVPDIEDAEQIVTGWYASCALGSDGSAWCWGFGTNCQLGDGLSKHTPYPVKVN